LAKNLFAADYAEEVYRQVFRTILGVQFRLATTVYRCLHGMAPDSRYQLRSSQSNQLIVPPVKLSTYGPRSFALAGPTVWNNLPVYLRDPKLSLDNFRRQLKTFLFAQY